MKYSVLIFGRQGCGKCETTQHKVGHYVKEWGLAHEVDVICHDLSTVGGLEAGRPYDILSIPTTIVLRDGENIARHEGDAPREDWLKKCFGLE